MLKHLTITAGIAALLIGISIGYVSAALNLNSSRSNIYRTTDGKPPIPFTYNFSIDHGTATLSAADKKAILQQACEQAAKDIK